MLRMPLQPVALELLRETGPLAVSSANVSRQPPATTAQLAQAQLGALVDAHLDGGPSQEQAASTIIDSPARHPASCVRAGQCCRGGHGCSVWTSCR